MNEPQRDPYRIASIVAATQVLDVLGRHSQPLSLGSIAEELELDKTRIFRILETLVSVGYVEKYENSKEYVIGPSVRRLRNFAKGSADLASIAMPIMRRLSTQVEKSISLGVLEGSYVRYTARVPFRSIISTNIEVGTLLPAHLSSMGRLLLAFLPEPEVIRRYGEAWRNENTNSSVTNMVDLTAALADIRASGYSIVKGDLDPVLNGIAAPIVDGDDFVLAALSVSYVENSEAIDSELTKRLVVAAGEISRELTLS